MLPYNIDCIGVSIQSIRSHGVRGSGLSIGSFKEPMALTDIFHQSETDIYVILLHACLFIISFMKLCKLFFDRSNFAHRLFFFWLITSWILILNKINIIYDSYRNFLNLIAIYNIKLNRTELLPYIIVKKYIANIYVYSNSNIHYNTG